MARKNLNLDALAAELASIPNVTVSATTVEDDLPALAVSVTGGVGAFQVVSVDGYAEMGAGFRWANVDAKAAAIGATIPAIDACVARAINASRR